MFGGWRITRLGILFIIGVLLLGGLVAGGILVAQNRGETARRDEAIKIAEQKLKDDSQGVTQPIASDPAVDTDKNTDDAPAVVTAADTEALPETGPEDIGNILAVTMLALSVALYVSSRRIGQHL